MSKKKGWTSEHEPRAPVAPQEHENRPFDGTFVPVLQPIETHPTVGFIRQIHEGRRPTDTDLWARIQSGYSARQVARRIGRDEIDTEEALNDYTDFVRGYLARTGREGITPTPADGEDVDIGIAIVGTRVFKYRRGMHRFASARALGLASIPVRAYFFTRDANLNQIEAFHEDKSGR